MFLINAAECSKLAQNLQLLRLSYAIHSIVCGCPVRATMGFEGVLKGSE